MRRHIGPVASAVVLAAVVVALLPGVVRGADSGTNVGVSPGQALLIALGYYLANSPWLFGLAFFTLFRPLVAGLFVGLILGDPAQGTLIGASINLAYLGFISAGGSLPGDPALAGWIGVAVAMAGHLSPGQAIAIAVPIGLLGNLIFYSRMTVDSIFAHWADDRADAADIRGVALLNWVPGQLFLLVISVVPVYVMAVSGTAAINDALAALAPWVLNGLAIAGGLLPAIGIALNMLFIFRGEAMPYFFIGYILVVATVGLPIAPVIMIVAAALGLILAYLHLTFTRPQAAAAAATEPPPPAPVAAAATTAPARTIALTRGDILRSWVTWTIFSHANYNYERLQGTGFAHAMTPIIRKLYHSPDEIRAALKRHLVFFNTEPNFGNVVHGTVIAMEEQRANGAAIDDDAIIAVKSGLMGPMAGIGDTISQGTLVPIFLALGIGVAGASAASGQNIAGEVGNPLGAVLYLVLISVSVIAIGYIAWMQGYARGRSFITELLRSGRIERLLVGASVLGNLVLGALAARTIVVFLAPTLDVGRGINLQLDVLDKLAPGILPLALVLLTWWLLRRRVNALTLLAIYVAVSIVAAYPFFGAGPKNANDFSYGACTSSILHPYTPCTPPASASPAP